MLHLIQKDIMIFLNRWNIIFLLAFTLFILFGANTAIPEGQYILIASTIAFFSSTTPFAYDEISNSEFIIQSMPVTRKEIVFGKYIGVIVSLFIGIIYAALVFFLLNILGLLEIDFLKIDLIFLIPFIVLLMVSINFPLYFKVGYKKAKIANILLFMVFFMVMNALTGDLEKTKSILLPLIELPGLNFLIPIIIAAITTLSITISLRLYTTKDL